MKSITVKTKSSVSIDFIRLIDTVDISKIRLIDLSIGFTISIFIDCPCRALTEMQPQANHPLLRSRNPKDRT